MSESKFNRFLMGYCSDLKMDRLEDKGEVGYPDFIITHRKTGKISLLESKFERANRKGQFKMKVRQGQVLYHYEMACAKADTYIVCDVSDVGYFLIKSEPDLQWMKNIKEKLDLEKVAKNFKTFSYWPEFNPEEFQDIFK